MKKIWIPILVIGLSFIANSSDALAFFSKKDADEQRQGVLARSTEILSELYRSQPSAKASVEGAYGYATFSNFGMKIFLAGGGTGRGVAVNNKTKARTFMRMAEVQAGLGLGVKKFMLIWIFENEQSFNNFVNSGWAIGAQASAAAKAGGAGGSYQGAVPIASGVWLYQLTDAGLALELTAKGTKYYKDGKLN